MTLHNEQMLARYSQWANEVIYSVVAGLPEAAVVAPRETTFGSVRRTLGHNYAVGAIFRAHLERRAAQTFLSVLDVAAAGPEGRDSEGSESDSGKRLQAASQVHTDSLNERRVPPTTTMRFGAFPSFSDLTQDTEAAVYSRSR